MSVADKVRSPCVSICALDENNEERREVLRKVSEREKRSLIHG